MGLITDLFFAIGNFFKWTFENLLEPIGYWSGWIFTIIGIGLLLWWLKQLLHFGNDNEKKYNGW